MILLYFYQVDGTSQNDTTKFDQSKADEAEGNYMEQKNDYLFTRSWAEMEPNDIGIGDKSNHGNQSNKVEGQSAPEDDKSISQVVRFFKLIIIHT